MGDKMQSNVEIAAVSAAPLEDWVTIWQSEAAAMVVDRELHEAMQAAVDGRAAQMRVWAALLDAAARFAGTDAKAGPAPLDAALDGRDAVIQSLLDRVAELERRLAPPASER